MCSQNRVALSPTAQSRITEQFNFSDEETDEEESGDSVKLFRCRSAPAADAIRDQGKTTMLEKSKTERAVKRGGGFSLEDRMKEWHRSSVVDRKAESAAKKYQEMVSNDTLKHLRNSVLVAGSIAGKGADINEELRRQERVLRKADTDISHAEYETDQTTETLKGMKSLRSKLTSSIRKKKPKLKVQTFNDFDLLDGEIGLSSMSSMFTRKKNICTRRLIKRPYTEGDKGGYGRFKCCVRYYKGATDGYRMDAQSTRETSRSVRKQIKQYTYENKSAKPSYKQHY